MPKRSNDFQKVILHLQSLTSPGYKVKESHFLKDSITGQMREVDIVIESNIAGYESIVSIEVILLRHISKSDTTYCVFEKSPNTSDSAKIHKCLSSSNWVAKKER